MGWREEEAHVGWLGEHVTYFLLQGVITFIIPYIDKGVLKMRSKYFVIIAAVVAAVIVVQFELVILVH